MADYGNPPIGPPPTTASEGKTLWDNYFARRVIKDIISLKDVNILLRDAFAKKYPGVAGAAVAPGGGNHEQVPMEYAVSLLVGDYPEFYRSEADALTQPHGIMARFGYLGVCADEPDQIGNMSCETTAQFKMIAYVADSEPGDVIEIVLDRPDPTKSFMFVPTLARKHSGLYKVGDGAGNYHDHAAPRFRVGTVLKIVQPTVVMQQVGSSMTQPTYHSPASRVSEAGHLPLLAMSGNRAISRNFSVKELKAY